MNINSIQNCAFKGIYAVYGSKDRMTRLEHVLNTHDARQANISYLDATDTFEHIGTIRHLDQVKYRDTALEGGKVGFILTDDDADEVEFIDEVDEDTVHTLTFNTDEKIDMDQDNIPNIF